MISSLIFAAVVCVGYAGAATLPTTGYDATFTRACAANSILYRVRSWHNNHKEDRQWVYYCKSGYPISSSAWSGYVNSWDGKMNYKCGSNSVITGLNSQHNNRKEDRLWKIRCSKLDSALRLSSCGLSGNINSWDSKMDYSVSSTRVINGFYSVHNNHKEDRLWKVYYCSVCTTKKVYRAWGAWSSCTKQCTGSDGVSGTQTRSRTCYSGHSGISFCSGYSCSTPEKQTQKCGTQRCKINGGFSNWSAYGACSKSCGAGTKTRTRKCNNPTPAYGGANCVGPTTQSTACKVRECPVNGGFSNWSAYGACSKSCGAGTRTRTRKCNNPAPAYGGANCVGPTTQSMACKVRECPVDGQYGAWSVYSTCSASCGTGLKTRTRKCSDPAPAHGGAHCVGNNLEAALCLVKPCPKPTPVDGQYGAWSNFTACSTTCGTGIKTRTRKCSNPAPANGGACCSGASVETVLCQTKPCADLKDVMCSYIGGTCRLACASNEKKSKEAKKKCTDRGYMCCLVPPTAGTTEA